MSADTFTLMAFDVTASPGPERWCSYVDNGRHYVGGDLHRTRSLARAEAHRIAEARRGPGGPARQVEGDCINQDAAGREVLYVAVDAFYDAVGETTSRPAASLK